MSKSRLGLGLVFAALAGGCDASAEDQCNELIATICTRVRVCTEEATDNKAPADFESECVEEVEKSTGVCSNAVDVSSSYDKCIDDIEDSPCDIFLKVGNDNTVSLGLPTTCRGAIQVE